jgi:hypothetical protein
VKILKHFNSNQYKNYRFFVGAAAGLFSSLLLLSALLIFQPFTTKAFELLACWAYITDYNITNVICAVYISLVMAILIFIIVSFSNFSLLLAPRVSTIVQYLINKLTYLQIGAKQIAMSNIFQSLINCIAFSDTLTETRKQKKSFLLSNLFWIIFAVPSLALIACLPLFAPFYEYIRTSAQILQLLLFAMLIFIWIYKPQNLSKFNFSLQFLSLPYFLLIIPLPVNDGFHFYYITDNNKLLILSAILVLLSVSECVIKRKKILSECYFAIMPLLAVLIGLKFSSYMPDALSQTNIYEFGSRISNYWMIMRDEMVLFKDISMTYGLWDILGYWLGQFLLNGLNMVNANIGYSFLMGIAVYSVFFLLARKITGSAIAFVLAFICDSFSVLYIWIFILILLQNSLIKNPFKWLFVWVIMCALSPYARIPQGAMVVCSSIPAGAYMLFCLYKQNKKHFISIIVLGIFLSFTVMLWPLGDIFKGFIRIFTETAKNNSHWAAFFHINLPQKHSIILYFLLTIKVALYLLVPMLSIAVAYRMYNSNVLEGKTKAVFLLGFTLIYSFLSVSYSFSRIQLGSRASQTVSTLAGLILFITISSINLRSLNGNLYPLRIFKNKKGAASFILFLICIILLAKESVILPFPKNIFWEKQSIFYNQTYGIENGQYYGIYNIGKGIINKEYLLQDAAVKAAMDKILSENETFLDLTNEGQHYFTSERKLWLEYPINFVYPCNIAQKRAVETLKEKNIKVSLLDNSTVYDMSPVNIRGYHLYRYALLNGLPWEISKYKTIIMPKEYFNKIGILPPTKKEALIMLDKQFPQNEITLQTSEFPIGVSFPKLNFYNLPAVWGRGYKKFAKYLPIAAELPKPTKKPEKTYKYNVNICGADAGLLYLDLDIVKKITVKVNWIDEELPQENNNIAFMGHPGINLIPLDSSPRWLLADNISSITISSNDNFIIKNAKILDRKNF